MASPTLQTEFFQMAENSLTRGSQLARTALSRQPPGLYLLRVMGPDGRGQTLKLLR